jgi:hypothetical protein
MFKWLSMPIIGNYQTPSDEQSLISQGKSDEAGAHECGQ